MIYIVVVVVRSIAFQYNRESSCVVSRECFVVHLVKHISIASCRDIVVVKTQYSSGSSLSIFHTTTCHLTLVSSEWQLGYKEVDIIHHKVVTLIGSSEIVDGYANPIIAFFGLDRENHLLPLASFEQLAYEINTYIVPLFFVIVFTLDIAAEDRVTFS